MSDGGKQAMVAASRTIKSRKAAPAAAAPSNVPADPLVALRDRTWGLAAEWEQMGWPWMAALIRGATVLSKGER
jgi:hypothetical protein